MRRRLHAGGLLVVVVVVATSVVVGVEVRPAVAADVNPYVAPLRRATASVEATARQIAALETRGTSSQTACRTAANRLAVSADAAREALTSYENARLRYGTQEEFGLLRSLLLQLYDAQGGISRLSGTPRRVPSTGDQNAARREVSLFRQVVAARVADRFQIEGLEDVLTARGLRDMKEVVVNELHSRLKTTVEEEIRRLTGLGIAVGVPLKLQIRRHAELTLSRLLTKLVFKAGPAGILIQLVAGEFVDPGRIIQVIGAQLREALRPKGNLAKRAKQSVATLEKSRGALNALPPNVATEKARRAIREAERTLNATRFLEGDLKRAGDTDRLAAIAAAKKDLQRTMRLTSFRFLLDSELVQYNFRDAIAFAQRTRSDALAAAKTCAGTKPPTPPTFGTVSEALCPAQVTVGGRTLPRLPEGDKAAPPPTGPITRNEGSSDGRYNCRYLEKSPPTGGVRLKTGLAFEYGRTRRTNGFCDRTTPPGVLGAGGLYSKSHDIEVWVDPRIDGFDGVRRSLLARLEAAKIGSSC